MSIARRSAKRDAAEPAIVSALEALGCVVWRVSGKGLPDLVVFCRKGRNPDGSIRRTTFVADVKGPKEKATPAQEEKWTALLNLGFSVFILHTPEDAAKMLNNALQPWEPSPTVVRKVLPQGQTYASPRKGDAANAREEVTIRTPLGPRTRKPNPHYTPPRSTPVDAANEAEATFAAVEQRRSKVCLDPDKMKGAGDQFPGSDYD